MTLQHQINHPQEINHKRLTRNFHELLQELRVTQTGVQILTGFLLTLPFSTRFAHLTSTQRHVYLAILAGSVIATGLIIAPVAFHRMLFQRGQRQWIVKNANRAARAGLLSLALTTSGVVWLVFDLVTDPFTAGVAGSWRCCSSRRCGLRCRWSDIAARRQTDRTITKKPFAPLPGPGPSTLMTGPWGRGRSSWPPTRGRPRGCSRVW